MMRQFLVWTGGGWLSPKGIVTKQISAAARHEFIEDAHDVGRTLAGNYEIAREDACGNLHTVFTHVRRALPV